MEYSLKDVLEIVTEGMDEIDVLIMLIQTSVAAEIAIQRQRKGMTQGDLAKKMNVSAPVVSKWESGIRDLRLSTLVKIADALDIGIRSPFVTDVNVGDEEMGNRMTREEAIKILKAAVSWVEWEYPMDIAAALDKAIEALETDTCEIKEIVEDCEACKFCDTTKDFVSCPTRTNQMQNWRNDNADRST